MDTDQAIDVSGLDPVGEPVHAAANLNINVGTNAGATEQVLQPVTLELQQSVSMYTVYRQYLVHEDDLVHQRTTWSITIQGFLIVAFGLAFQNKVKIFEMPPVVTSTFAPPLLDRQYSAEIFILAILGIGVSLICLLAVLAAQRAINGLRRSWASWHRRHQGLPDYPDLAGGGDWCATLLGHQLPVCLQAFFAGFWIIVVLVLLAKMNLIDYPF